MLQYRYTISYMLALLLSASTLFSCENTIDLDDEDFTPRLALTYLGSTEGEAQQRFYISESFISQSPRIIKDAKLEVFVNGQLKETVTSSTFQKGSASYPPSDYEKEQPHRYPYLIKKQFKAGDKLKFRVSHPNFNQPAEVTTVVSEAPNFNVEMKEVVRVIKNSHSDYTRELLQFNIKVQDLKNADNYYRLKIHYSDLLGQNVETPTIENREDFIMMKGQPQTDDDDISIDISENYRNNYNVFSDEFFKDKEGLITVYCRTPSRNARVEVTVESIDPTLYRYLQVIDNTDSDNPLVTPSVLPTNVKGGVGVVSVAGSKTTRLTYIEPIRPVKPF